MMPQRAKVRRVCGARNGWSSGLPIRKRMRAAGQETRIEEGRDIGGRYRAIADAPLCRLDLDQRLQKEHAPRAGADNFDRQTRAPALPPRSLRRPCWRQPRARPHPEGQKCASWRARLFECFVDFVRIQPPEWLAIDKGGRAMWRKGRGNKPARQSVRHQLSCHASQRQAWPRTVAAKPSLPMLWQASPRQSCRR